MLKKRDLSSLASDDDDHHLSKRLQLLNFEEPDFVPCVQGLEEIMSPAEQPHTAFALGKTYMRTTLPSNDENIATKPEPAGNRTFGADYDPMESFVQVLRGGRPRYVRKIDYLVDELIRKSARKFEIGRDTGIEGADVGIPDAIGPDPRTDLPILNSHLNKMANKGGMLGLDPQWPLLKSNLAESIRNDEGDEASESGSNSMITASHPELGGVDSANSLTQLINPARHSQSLIVRTSSSASSSSTATTSLLIGAGSSSSVVGAHGMSPSRAPTVTHAGDVTHSDWTMEEISTTRQKQQGAVGAESDADFSSAMNTSDIDNDKMETLTVSGDSDRASNMDTESEPSTDDSLS